MPKDAPGISPSQGDDLAGEGARGLALNTWAEMGVGVGGSCGPQKHSRWLGSRGARPALAIGSWRPGTSSQRGGRRVLPFPI